MDGGQVIHFALEAIARAAAKPYVEPQPNRPSATAVRLVITG